MTAFYPILAGLITGIPFLGFLLNALSGKMLPKGLSMWASTLAILCSFIISLWFFFQPDIPGNIFISEWFSVGSWRIDFAYLIDPLSNLLMLIITGVGFLIHVYSIGYMKDDENVRRYFAYLNLFVFFMLILVMGNSLLLMFVGWEGVGLCSYLLIGYWYKSTEFNRAAKKAFVMNRIGDVGFVLAMFFILSNFRTLEYDGLLQSLNLITVEESTITIITLLLFLAATGKSAQIPLFTWLPDAMAGPTPVSALIHAATMVTAGVYMIGRLTPLFALAPVTLEVVLWVGTATCLMGALIGLKQNDIKKVLAYSTVSQLGLLFAALGAGAFTGAFFHLTTHAFFKALLFLGAGSVIHAMGGEQDIRKMGGLKGKIKITFFTFLIATIAISGIPPLSGFFSKDEILAGVYAQNPLVWGILQFSSLLTVFYMFRLLYLVFFGKFRGDHHTESHLHESPPIMTLPLMILMILSVIGGLLGLPELFGFHHWLHEYLQPNLGAIESHHPDHTTEIILMTVATAGAIGTIILASLIYLRKKSLPPETDKGYKGFSRLLSGKFFVDELYEKMFQLPMNWIAEKTYFWIERWMIDASVNGMGNLVLLAGRKLRLIQTGSVGFYIFAMTLGIILVLILQYLQWL